MDEENLTAVIEILSLVMGELADAPLEDFIKQVNYMLKNNTFNDRFPKEVMIQFLVLSQGLLNVKSTILLGFTAFQEFKG